MRNSKAITLKRKYWLLIKCQSNNNKNNQNFDEQHFV